MSDEFKRELYKWWAGCGNFCSGIYLETTPDDDTLIIIAEFNVHGKSEPDIKKWIIKDERNRIEYS